MRFRIKLFAGLAALVNMCASGPALAATTISFDGAVAYVNRFGPNLSAGASYVGQSISASFSFNEDELLVNNCQPIQNFYGCSFNVQMKDFYMRVGQQVRDTPGGLNTLYIHDRDVGDATGFATSFFDQSPQFPDLKNVQFQGRSNGNFIPDRTNFQSLRLSDFDWTIFLMVDEGDTRVHVRGPLTVGVVNSAVPEPATWAMMLFGFGFVGAALRRSGKRQRNSLTSNHA